MLAGAAPAFAQDPGTLDPKPLPPLENPDAPATAAKELFGRKTEPAKMAPSSIGFYAKGCLAGGVALPIDGPAWQVMRLSRNRNWGNPHLISFLEHLAAKGQEGRLERPSGRRHVAAARRADAAPDTPATRSASTPTSGSRRCPTTRFRAKTAR